MSLPHATLKWMKWLAKHAAFITSIWGAMLFLDVPTGLKWWQVFGGGTFLGIANVIYARWLR